MSKNISPPDYPRTALEELDERSREIFRTIVDSYFETGEPLGSRTLSRQLTLSASPATIRNVMSDLESLGLIYAPHTSAGRLPTDIGLRFFVDSFMEIGNLAKHERTMIEAKVQAASDSQTMENILTEASQMLSGLSRSAGMVITTKNDMRLKHIEFIRLEPTRALVVIVGENSSVENRVIALPAGITTSALIEASNYINAKIAGRTIAEAQAELSRLHNMARMELDSLAQKLVDQGIAVWAGTGKADAGQLIISGHANLLENLTAADDLDRLRNLFGELESKENFLKLLELTEEGEGVRIFIGSENKLFSMSGSSVIVAPYRDQEQRVIGAIGIIGPTRLNYARIIPMVDHTANVISKILR
ncbi:MAG: heat-inducible transcriptional repressor HrcA [Rhizobiaceae bacterium]|nr:heat-inducible transcriptional repressor HrcA [Rhizobiaceae bacterium]MBL4696917.1 heat-inducible transcriptional repressor HrcA [Rhizobiaceae bacterium]